MISALALAALQPPAIIAPPAPPSRRSARPAQPSCELPAVEASTRLIVAGFYEAESVSTVAVAGPGEETTVADVEIEPGAEPLTLVFVNFDPIIYRFAGAIRRVRQLILLGNKGAGAVGIARRRVSFARARDCDLPYSIYQGPAGLYAPRIRALFGREADVQGGVYGLHRMRVGSHGLSFTAARRGRDPMRDPFEEEMYRFYPGGIVEVDPRQVVAARPVEPYEVLPSTAGIVQLLREGALRPAGRADIDEWLVVAAATGRYSTTQLASARGSISHSALRVMRPIVAPVGLCGAHLVTFIVPDMSYLRGDVCHSAVLDMSLGEGRGGLLHDLERR